MQNVTDINPEAEDSTLVADNAGGALSIPLAAIGFMTRLATGIFSKGRKNLDPSSSDSQGENDLQSPGTANFSPKGESTDESNSKKQLDVNNCNSLTSYGGDDEHVDTEAKDLLDVAEALCSLKPEEPNAPARQGDETSFFKGFDITKDPYDHYFLGSSGQVYSFLDYLFHQNCFH